MNREIKFRAWDGKKMIYHNWRDRESQVHDLWQFVVAIDTACLLLQFTGKLSKSGDGIYQGDIISGVLTAPSISAGQKRLGYVGYDERECRFKVIVGTEESGSFYGLQQFKFIKVLGNIYENPDLLK